MFQFSKKLVCLLFVTGWVIGGIRLSAEALAHIKCNECLSEFCDPLDHAGIQAICPNGACAMTKTSDGKVRKFCERDPAKFKDTDGYLKCNINVECYCNYASDCNLNMTFCTDGFRCPGRGSGIVGDIITKNGSVENLNIFPAMTILCCIVAWLLYVTTSGFPISIL